MKKVLFVTLCFAFILATSNQANAQFFFPFGAGFGLDTPDIQNAADELGFNGATPSSNTVQITPKRTLEDSLLHKEETEVKKLELRN